MIAWWADRARELRPQMESSVACGCAPVPGSHVIVLYLGGSQLSPFVYEVERDEAHRVFSDVTSLVAMWAYREEFTVDWVVGFETVSGERVTVFAPGVVLAELRGVVKRGKPALVRGAVLDSAAGEL